MKSVLVTVDALRADHLGQYGYHRDTLPALDRLVDEGTLYEAAYVNGPHSGVSIPSVLASQYRGREAIESGPNVATALSGAGVRTAAFHSNTMIANELDGFAGFDAFEDFDVAGDGGHERFEKSPVERAVEGAKRGVEPVVRGLPPVRWLYERLSSDGFHFQVYVDAETLTDRAISWLEEHGDEDFFLWLHYMDPHRPYGVDPEDQAYTDERVPEDRIRELMPRAGQEPESITDQERDLLIDLYDSDIRYTSTHLDRLFDGIERRCGLDETLIAFTADHGEEFGEHGRYFHTNYPYDELLHVPLIVRRPDREGGRVSEQRELLDIAPTICEFHGASPPDAFEGAPLSRSGTRTVVTTGSLRADGEVIGVRTGDRKYVYVGDGADELYDLDSDPGERRNVIESEGEAATSLRGEIPADLLSGTERPSPDEASGATRKRLADLGYLE